MRFAILLIISAFPAQADVVLAARNLRPNTIVTAADLVVKPATIPGALDDPLDVVGQETRIAIYAGRPVLQGDIGPPAIIERNQIIDLLFSKGGISILAQGRSLGRAGAGDRLRVMNLDSRTTVWGVAQPDGSVIVE